VNPAWALCAALLVLPGCLQSGPDGSDTQEGDLPDLPLQAVRDGYYDVFEEGQPNIVREAQFMLAGALGGDVRYHTWEEVEAKLHAWNETHPRLVELRQAGTTNQGRAVWDVVITDETVAGEKLAPLLDGGHHGNEYAGSEIMLYVGDLLLENHGTNATVQEMLRRLEIHIVPVVNPDGYVAGTRHNGMGVNLNRNYDVDWGNPLGTSNPVLGAVSELTDRPTSGVGLVAENCGPFAFSEPESQAMRDLMESLAPRAAFYLTGHTPTHSVIAPPAAYDEPFVVPPDHRQVLDEELAWINSNTEYEAGYADWGDFSAGLPYAASGSSMDYFYMVARKPAFTVEVEYFVTAVTSDDYPGRLVQDFEGLRYWMDATLPLPMHLLANAAQLAQWQSPTEDPLLPEGYERPDLRTRERPQWPYLH
jgi:hypothetical protein